MESQITKPCTKCGEEKALSEFWACRSAKDGRASACKSCKTDWQIARDLKFKALYSSTPPYTLKICKKCGLEKRVDEFPSGTGAYGRHTNCTVCGTERKRNDRAQMSAERSAEVRAQKRKHSTGFTAGDMRTANTLQGGCCAICGTDFSAIGTKRTHADHDHLTREKRGLLCGNCNKGLGMFNDSTILLRRAAEYLENPPLRGVL